jgi:hypothetical protein
MVDIHGNKKAELHSPAEYGASIAPSDSTDLTNATRKIYVGGTGDIKVDLLKSGTVTFKSVPVGTTLEVRAKRVYATGTTATNLVALW